MVSQAILPLFGIPFQEGIAGSLDGNQLPNAPEHTIKLGLGYTLPFEALAGDITFRWDYYWQDDTYAREFNTKGDEIDSWDQHNAAIIYNSNNGKWSGRLWSRNLQDEDNVTGHYLTADTSGYFRNYFTTEPRIYGLSVRYNFGE
jgi:outer membrane receptor protein involved in Fe transport